MNDRLFIVLPTYNGALYLSEQIRSIQDQTVDSWQLLIRDDGSRDDTLEVLKQHVGDDPRIHLIEDELGNLGPLRSFSLLAELALKRDADYVAFSDQDDSWLPQKLADTMSRMKTVEEARGAKSPVLVHTDLQIVNESLELISQSFMQHENIRNPERPTINRILVQNHVVGCTMLANRPLLEKATPIPGNVRMHDWWFAGFSVVAGELNYLSEATIRYRQHESNTLGSTGFNQIYNPFLRTWRHKLAKRPALQRTTANLARELRDRLTGQQTSAQQAILEDCHACLHKRWGIARVLCAVRSGMSGQNWAASLIFLTLLLVSRWQKTASRH